MCTVRVKEGNARLERVTKNVLLKVSVVGL